MYILSEINPAASSSLQPGSLAKRVLKRFSLDPGTDDVDTVTPLDIDYKAPIAVGVSLGVAFIVLMVVASYYLFCRRNKRKTRKQSKKQKVPSSIELTDNKDESETLVPEVSENLPLKNEKEDQEAISKPSSAVLHTMNSLVSSSDTKYEYEPLPPYEPEKPNLANS